MTRPVSPALPGRSFEVAGDGDPRGMITTFAIVVCLQAA